MALENLKATVADFIMAFGEVETLELSHINTASESEEIDENRILNALELAFQETMSYDCLCGFAGKYAIRKSLKRLMLDIARYRLDAIERRQDLVDTYERILDFFKDCRELKESFMTKKISKEEAADLGLEEFRVSRTPTVKRGRLAFDDEYLERYRKQGLYF